ncbi:hypothetical protein LCGC14_0646720 [marine sediment metagenome]|uniref:Uncharacterized protein n=1 Tax=marine sediment metagenome TaxID=412755 RepID=A0A0F9TJ62_9ZZZZ
MKERFFGENIREAYRILREDKMSDKIEVTGIEIKINGNKATLNIEDAWELKRELDKLLHAESVPYPYPVYPGPVSPLEWFVAKPYMTWGSHTGDPLPDPSITIC